MHGFNMEVLFGRKVWVEIKHDSSGKIAYYRLIQKQASWNNNHHRRKESSLGHDGSQMNIFLRTLMGRVGWEIREITWAESLNSSYPLVATDGWRKQNKQANSAQENLCGYNFS